MSSLSTTEARELAELKAKLIEDMARAEKESDYRWYKTCEREVRHIERQLAEVSNWAAQAA